MATKFAVNEDNLVPVPDYKRQKEIIQPFLLQEFAVGDEWYLVDAKWLKKWKKYTGYNDWDHTSAGNENDNPGPIDNFNLFKNQTSEDLKDHLKEDDYSLLPKAAYDILVDWYGLSPGSRPIRRCVVEFGSTISKTLKVEIYIFDIKLCVHSNINETKSCPFSRADTVRKVQNKLIELFQVPEGTETRVWQVWPDFMKNRYDLLSNVDQTVSDVGIYGGQLIMLEIKDSHGQWPCEKMNVCKQAREQQQLKVQSGVVFESVIMRLGALYFKKLKTEFLALQDSGATLISFKDDKKISIIRKYPMTTCISVGPRTGEHDNAGWPADIPMERCFIFNKAKNSLVYFIAETPELAKEWIEKLEEAREKTSIITRTMSVVETGKPIRSKMPKKKDNEIQYVAKVYDLVVKDDQAQEELLNRDVRLDHTVNDQPIIPDPQIKKVTAGVEMRATSDPPVIDERTEEKKALEKHKSSQVTVLITETEQPKISFKSLKTLLTQQETEVLQRTQQLMSVVDSLAAENEASTGRHQEQINRLTREKDELVREKRQLETNLTNKERELEEKIRENTKIENDKKILREENDALERKNATLEEEKMNLEGEKRKLEEKLKNEQQALQEKISANKQGWKISHKDVKMTEQELGRGGWGVIWVGEFRGQKVAIKQMHKSIVSEHNLQLLHREINTMSQLRHPNLVQFIGAVLDDPSGQPLIIAEIMDMSLHEAYKKKQLTPVPVNICLSIMRDVAVGLNYLHCLPDPIIHRDVSSANVLLESKGIGSGWKTKISDFGSAKFACAAITKAAGAAAYSAPEAFQSMSILDDEEDQLLTPKMDVFSYGILLCEVLTCQFPDKQVFKAMLAQVHSQHHPYLHDLIQSCIERNPQDRPNIDQVIQQLDHSSYT